MPSKVAKIQWWLPVIRPADTYLDTETYAYFSNSNTHGTHIIEHRGVESNVFLQLLIFVCQLSVYCAV